MTNLDNLYCAILNGNVSSAVELTKNLIEDSIDTNLIIREYITKAMIEIGVRVEEGKAFEPELMMAARAMNAAMEILKPLLPKSETNDIGSFFIGSNERDTPAAGQTQVINLLEGSGFDVVNLEAKIPNN